jgi:DNA-binding NtrC family response regulator
MGNTLSFPKDEATEPGEAAGATAGNGAAGTRPPSLPVNSEADAPLVLVADDDPCARRLLRRYLEHLNYTVLEAPDGETAMALMNETISVALLDLRMPKASGTDCLRFIRERYPDTSALVISASGQIPDAVEAMKLGAIDYLTKPVNPDELVPRVQQAVRAASLARENRCLRQAFGYPSVQNSLVERSPVAKALRQQITKIAGLDTTVLITGESGTGKSTLARMIHQASTRRPGPFVAVSCAALPRDLIEAELFGHERGAFTGAVAARPGRAEMADGGTLFLDEIGDMPLELQPKLLTFLEDRMVQRLGGSRQRHVNVRLVAATHQDLESLCLQKRFRQDLYFRLNVLSLHVPPLRERKEDIPDLVNEVLGRIARQRRCPPYILTNEALQALMLHDWPGNVRELENILESATAFCSHGTLTQEDMKFSSLSTPGLPATALPAAQRSLAGLTLKELERLALADTLRMCNGNKAQAARRLGISEKGFYNKIKRFNLTQSA